MHISSDCDLHCDQRPLEDQTDTINGELVEGNDATSTE